MEEKEEVFEKQLKDAAKPVEVKFITSFICAAPDIEDKVKHLQFTVVQEVESKKMRCYFDVVDPSKVKVAEK